MHPALGVAAPLAAALAWGAFVAPRSQRRLTDPARLAVELAVFGAATYALVAIGQPDLAAVFAVAALVTAALVRR